MAKASLSVREEVGGVDHMETFDTVGILAQVLQYQGKYDEAESMNRRVLVGDEKLLGVNHPDTLTSVDKLALVLRYHGKYEHAESMNRRALAGYVTPTSVYGLAYLLGAKENFQQAF